MGFRASTMAVTFVTAASLTLLAGGAASGAFAADASATPEPGLAVRDALAKKERVTLVRVDKSERRMWLMNRDKVVREFRISLGGNPIGPKQTEGDQRTPEGNYVIDWRNPVSVAYKSMHISYPNGDDKARARRDGVRPGGDIMIHGQHNGIGWLWWLARHFDWTNGCIGVANHDMDEIIALVRPGTPIVIGP